jgi:phosphatidylethanolamine/phosphatidyl-N-methylethanolamine N-methyltransferase
MQYLATFVAESLRNPRSIGAVVPSSRALAVAMARQVPRVEQQSIIELGPGTGAITAALIDLGIPRECLCLIENNHQLTVSLRKRFPGVRILEGDAARLVGLVERSGIDRVTTIVSGLPLRTLNQRTRHSVLEQSFEILGAAGLFSQFTYHLRSPVSPDIVEQLGLVARKTAHVWLNLPPASIWEYRRR